MCTGGEDKKARGLSRRDTVSRVPWKSDRFDIGSFGVGLSRLSKTFRFFSIGGWHWSVRSSFWFLGNGLVCSGRSPTFYVAKLK